jgi:hypothetical protein
MVENYRMKISGGGLSFQHYFIRDFAVCKRNRPGQKRLAIGAFSEYIVLRAAEL